MRHKPQVIQLESCCRLRFQVVPIQMVGDSHQILVLQEQEVHWRQNVWLWDYLSGWVEFQFHRGVLSKRFRIAFSGISTSKVQNSSMGNFHGAPYVYWWSNYKAYKD